MTPTDSSADDTAHASSEERAGGNARAFPPVPDLSDREKEAAEQLMKRIRPLIPFDAYIVGLGRRNEAGAVEALRAACVGVPRGFIDNYWSIAEYDAAGQLFACNATSVIAASSLDDYPFDSTDAAKVGKYLRNHGVARLMLAGTDSSFGLAWATMYRLDRTGRLSALSGLKGKMRNAAMKPEALDQLRCMMPHAFTPDEAEIASYVVRNGLFEWQMDMEVTRDLARIDPLRYEMVKLTTAQLDVALRLARGWAHKTIAKDLSTGVTTVDKHASRVRSLLGPNKAISDRLIGRLPVARKKSQG